MLINKLFRKIALLFIKSFFLFFSKANKKIVIFAHPHSGNDMLRNILSIINSGNRYSLIKREKDNFGNREKLTLEFIKLNDKNLKENDVICYHLPYNLETKELSHFFIDNNYIGLVAIRDPRDILLSKYNRIMKRENDPYSSLFHSIESKEEKLKILLKSFMNKIGTDSLITVFQDYLNWQANKIQIIKYENLMGISGLSSEALKDKNKKIKAIKNQNQTINIIFQKLGLKSSYTKLLLVRSIVALTAVKGRVGSYSDMTESETNLFYKYFPKNTLDEYERL